MQTGMMYSVLGNTPNIDAITKPVVLLLVIEPSKARSFSKNTIPERGKYSYSMTNKNSNTNRNKNNGDYDVSIRMRREQQLLRAVRACNVGAKWC